MDGSSNNAYELGQSIGDAIGSAIVLLWVVLIVVGVLFVVLLVWFIWIMKRIKQENVKTNKLLNDFMKIVSRTSSGKSLMGSDISVSDELAKYKDLLDHNAITEEEYNLKKIQLLNK